MKKVSGRCVLNSLQIRGDFKKNVIFDGRVVKNGTAGLPWTIFANHWTAKVCIFDGRVVKNTGSRNSSALPALLAEVSQHPQLGATHPRAGGPGLRQLNKLPKIKCSINVIDYNRSEGEAERDIGSPCMIGLGLVVVEKFFRRRRRRRRRRHLGVDPKMMTAY